MSPRLSITDRFILFGILGQGFATIGTVWHVELAPVDEREALRRREYAALAGTIVSSSLIGAIAFALEPPDERR